MEALMDSTLKTQNHLPFYKQASFKWWMLALLLLMTSVVAMPYGYSFYQKSIIAKNNQNSVQNTLDQLLANGNTEEYSWMRTLNPKAKLIEGGVIWNLKKQQGIMKFKNLPTISKKQQYHFWIYDRATNQAVSSAIFQQRPFDPNSRLVEFKPEKPIKSPYKFILSLENVMGSGDTQILLRAQP